nr:uncharacterized protein LOC113814750 [Penaeus vannamei]
MIGIWSCGNSTMKGIGTWSVHIVFSISRPALGLCGVIDFVSLSKDHHEGRTVGYSWPDVAAGDAGSRTLAGHAPPKPNDKSESFCECVKENGRSGPIVKITCNFNRDQDVLLTRALYPFHASRVVSAYVRVADAKSVHVTRSFLEEWQSVPATALDLWRAGTLNFDVLYEYGNLHAYSPYRTSVGIGIVDCYVPEIPAKFMRDRDRGGLLIRNSRVDVFREGAFFNIKQMRYW